MTQWISFKEQIPPIGKKIIVTRTNDKSLGIITLFYEFKHEENPALGYFNSLGITEDTMKSNGGYWYLIPEPPEGEEK